MPHPPKEVGCRFMLSSAFGVEYYRILLPSTSLRMQIESSWNWSANMESKGKILLKPNTMFGKEWWKCNKGGES
jgi:hypothetical protein